MADRTSKRNEASRNAAQKSSRLTFLKEIIDYWPACVECGIEIRSIDYTLSYRRCGCPNKKWFNDINGWYLNDVDIHSTGK